MPLFDPRFKHRYYWYSDGVSEIVDKNVIGTVKCLYDNKGHSGNYGIIRNNCGKYLGQDFYFFIEEINGKPFKLGNHEHLSIDERVQVSFDAVLSSKVHPEFNNVLWAVNINEIKKDKKK